MLIISLLFYFIYGKSEISVSSNKVYGKTIFGKRVDLPIDMISAVSTCMFKGISVSTSSGKIKFFEIKNRDEIYDEINKLLTARVNNSSDVKKTTNSDSFDDIKKYKKLFDDGIITKE